VSSLYQELTKPVDAVLLASESIQCLLFAALPRLTTASWPPIRSTFCGGRSGRGGDAFGRDTTELGGAMAHSKLKREDHGRGNAQIEVDMNEPSSIPPSSSSASCPASSTLLPPSPSMLASSSSTSKSSSSNSPSSAPWSGSGVTGTCPVGVTLCDGS